MPNEQLENVPKNSASLWGTKTVPLAARTNIRFGGGVRYAGANHSYGPAFPNGVRTPSYTLVDALIELNHERWRFAINATNLFDKTYYAACLSRGDCFIGADRNVFGTVTYRF